METKIEKQFTTEAGFEAFVVLNETTSMQWRCGYVIIPEESSLFKMNVSYCVNLHDLDLDDPNIITKLKQQQRIYNVDVHSGITYNNFYYDKGYCIGFDCAHYQDTIEDKTLEYCINECESLAKQLKEIEGINMLTKINQLINKPIIAFILGYGIGLVNALLVLSK